MLHERGGPPAGAGDGSLVAAPAVRVVVVQVGRPRGPTVHPPALLVHVDVPVAAGAAQVEPATPADRVVRDQGGVRRRPALVVARRLHGDAADDGGLRRSLEAQDAEAGHRRRDDGDLDASHLVPFIG
jgi:hypothetical protein